MKQTLRAKSSKYISFIIAVVLLLGLVYYQYTRVLENTDHHLVYALDDTYIHMAMAKNLAKHGVYGVTKYEFSSSSSSPVWTLLLSLFYVIFGVNEWLPLVLNILIAIMILYVMYKILISNNVNQYIIAITLIAAIFTIPLYAMIFVGMEHLLHALISIIYIWLLSYLIKEPNKRQVILLYILTPFLVMTRMEGYFLVACTVILFTIFKEWKKGLFILILSLIPLLIYQYISVKNGWQWLPNSILIRSTNPILIHTDTQKAIILNVVTSWQTFINNIYLNYITGKYLIEIILIEVLMGFTIFFQARTYKKSCLIMLIMVVSVATCHFLFAKFGHFYRYEAYLVALSIFMFGLLLEPYVNILKNNFKKPFQIIILLLMIGIGIDSFEGLYKRAKETMEYTPLACKNIYEQQYQMAKFINLYYPTSTVAINDIGAITFFNDDVNIIDIVGLANARVYKLLSTNNYNSETLHQLCKESCAELAILYERWTILYGINEIPKDWTKICTWKLPYNIVCGDNIVSFFAIDEVEKNNMRQKMSNFIKELPFAIQVIFTE